MSPHSSCFNLERSNSFKSRLDVCRNFSTSCGMFSHNTVFLYTFWFFDKMASAFFPKGLHFSSSMNQLKPVLNVWTNWIKVILCDLIFPFPKLLLSEIKNKLEIWTVFPGKSYRLRVKSFLSRPQTPKAVQKTLRRKHRCKSRIVKPSSKHRR